MYKFTAILLKSDGHPHVDPNKKRVLRRHNLQGALYNILNVERWGDKPFVIMKDGKELYRHENLISNEKKVGRKKKVPAGPSEDYFKLLHEAEQRGVVQVLDHSDPTRNPRLKWVSPNPHRTDRKYDLQGKKYVIVAINPFEYGEHMLFSCNDYYDVEEIFRLRPHKKPHIMVEASTKEVAITKFLNRYLPEGAKDREEKALYIKNWLLQNPTQLGNIINLSKYKYG